MPFISEISSIYIQRFYNGWITLRNQLATPIRTMGRRIIELYDALITGNDWEVTPFLSLKRRAGHSAYVGLNASALNMVTWKSNTMGTIPVFDTTADVEYVNSFGTTTVITAKTVTTQIGMKGIGNYFYMGSTPSNLKFDGPSGQQGLTNWGIAFAESSVGPTTATTGSDYHNFPSNIAWSNPSNVTGTSGYATISLNAGQLSDMLVAGGFGFSVPAGANITGIKAVFNLSVASAGGSPNMGVSLSNGNTAGFAVLGVPFSQFQSSPTSITLGGPSNLWGASSITPGQVNASNFQLNFQLSNYSGTGVTTSQVNDVVVTIYTGQIPTATPTGSGTFSAVNGYTYVYAYGNSVSGEISNASLPSLNTGPFTNVAYVAVPVVASIDTQVNQIRVYRTTDSGGGNQFFEISNSPFPNTSATLQDTTIDTALQVTSQAEINLGNTPPPAGLINLEWFAGRMWGSVGNLLYASTGPETLSGTAPQSNWNPLFQWVIPGPIVRNVAGPNGMLVFTLDDCYIVRGTDITNYTVNEFVKDFGIRSYNCVDTDGTNLYVFTSDRQLICISAAGANDIGLPIGDQLLTVDSTQAYVTVNRYGLDSIFRILDVANNIYYDFNLNQQCWNLPGLLAMPSCTAAGSMETSPGVWQLLVSSDTYTTDDPPVYVSTTVAFRDINNFLDLGNPYQPNAVFGSIQFADPGQLAKIGAIGGFVLELTNAGTKPTLSVLPNDIGADLSQSAGAQVIGNFVTLANRGLNSPPTLGAQGVNYRSLVYYYSTGKGLSSYVRHLQFQVSAPAENFATELIGFCIFGDQKQETGQAGAIPQLQGR